MSWEMIKVEKDLTNIPSSLLTKTPKIGDEVKQRLENDFNHKCCYCEDNQIKGEVEHFIPKSKFPLLEYNWANLLWACHDCNNIKGDKDNCIINPTKEDPCSMFVFDLEGNIKDNTNIKAKNSIDTCGLNRENLKDKRKSVIDEFIRNLEFICAIGNKDLVLQYINDFFILPLINNKKLSFIALRKHVVENHLLEILRELCIGSCDYLYPEN
jgi:uncharacterized protein (TIGR02646 family)